MSNCKLGFGSRGHSKGKHEHQRGGKGTLSYKHVVVDRGKGPRGVVFKAPMTGTSRSDLEKGQERNQGKSECMGEDDKETQSEAQETTKANGTEGHNQCKPKIAMIPKVILDNPQTQLYRD